MVNIHAMHWQGMGRFGSLLIFANMCHVMHVYLVPGGLCSALSFPAHMHRGKCGRWYRCLVTCDLLLTLWCGHCYCMYQCSSINPVPFSHSIAVRIAVASSIVVSRGS